MRKYGWVLGLVLIFFGALPRIQSSVERIQSNGMTINSWALIIGGLIFCRMVIQHMKTLRKQREQEINRIQSSISSIESELSRESEARRYTDENELNPMIQKLVERISKLENKT